MMTTAADRPVVVTRPLANAGALADRLEAAGRRAVLFPLLEIHPLPDQTALRSTLTTLARYAMVAFVSPNAIDAAFAILEQWPAQVTIAVMGEGSRAALSRHGVTPEHATIISPRNRQRTDSHTLLEALDLDALRGKRVLIVRGETGRELLADALRSKGVVVEQIAAYRRTAPLLDQAGQAQLRHLLDAGPDWVITSSEALRILLGLARDVAGEAGVAEVQRQRIFVPHVRIQESAQALGFTDITQTASGDEQLVAALQFHA